MNRRVDIVAETSQRKAIFLAMEGALVGKQVPGAGLSDMELLPHVMQGLLLLRRRGFSLFVLSHQMPLGQGPLSAEGLEAVCQRLDELVAAAGLQFEDFYHCPHAVSPAARPSCSCHVPRPGLLWRAAVEHNIDLRHSWMIGNQLDHMEAGHGAGCRSALIDNGGEAEWRVGGARVPDVIAHDFMAAVRLMDDSPVSSLPSGRRGGAHF